MDETNQMEEWNMAKAYFYRIDRLLTMCADCQINSDVIKWSKTLLCLYKEIYPKMMTEEKTKANTFVTELTNLKLNDPTTTNVSISPFLNFEIFIRETMENKGMLTPKADDPSKSYRS
jgi:hypothetical protein